MNTVPKWHTLGLITSPWNITPKMMTIVSSGGIYALRWRHNERDNVSNHQPYDCLLNRLCRCRLKKTSKLRVTGLCAGNFTYDRWLPHTKSQLRGKCLPLSLDQNFNSSHGQTYFFTSHTWRHKRVQWCITIRYIPVMVIFKIQTRK